MNELKKSLITLLGTVGLLGSGASFATNIVIDMTDYLYAENDTVKSECHEQGNSSQENAQCTWLGNELFSYQLALSYAGNYSIDFFTSYTIEGGNNANDVFTINGTTVTGSSTESSSIDSDIEGYISVLDDPEASKNQYGMQLGYDFTLGEGESATVSFFTSSALDFTYDYYASQTNISCQGQTNCTETTVYFGSLINVAGGSNQEEEELVEVTQTTVGANEVPAPGTLLLLAAGLLGLAGTKRKSA